MSDAKGAVASFIKFIKPQDSVEVEDEKLVGAIGESESVTSAGTGKPSLAEVLSEYQVQADNVTQWDPKVFGVTIPFQTQNLTETEAEMLDALTTGQLLSAKDIASTAFATSEARYEPTGELIQKRGERWIKNDGHQDAFRHAYWNSLMTKNFGEEWAEQFGTAHEAYPNNTAAAREAMDLYNNEVGRRIATENPNASDEELADLVKNAVESGQLVVVDKDGNLAWSDQVELWEHGTAKRSEQEGAIPVPKGDANAEGES